MPSKLHNLVPHWYANSTALAGLVDAIGKPFDQWRAKLLAATLWVDPWAMSDDWLLFWGEVFGIDGVGLVEEAQRQALALISQTRGERGSLEALRAWLVALVPGGTITTVPTTAFIAGVSLAGDVCGPGTLSFSVVVDIPATSSYSTTTVSRYMALVMPAHIDYTVTQT